MKGFLWGLLKGGLSAAAHGAALGVGNGLVTLTSGVLAASMIGYSSFVIYDTAYTQNQARSVSAELLSYRPTIIDSEDVPLSASTLSLINDDYRAWLTIQNTAIDYPVVQGENDLYYASHDIYQNSSLTGSIYVAAANSPDFSDTYNLIYGHHMDQNIMFGALDRYLDETYLYAHRSGVLVTDTRAYYLTVFAVAETDAYEQAFYQAGNRMNEVLDFLRAPGSTTTVPFFDEYALAGANRILALSTCASATTNGRLVVLLAMKEWLESSTVPDDGSGGSTHDSGRSRTLRSEEDTSGSDTVIDTGTDLPETPVPGGDIPGDITGGGTSTGTGGDIPSGGTSTGTDGDITGDGTSTGTGGDITGGGTSTGTGGDTPGGSTSTGTGGDITGGSTSTGTGGDITGGGTSTGTGDDIPGGGTSTSTGGDISGGGTSTGTGGGTPDEPGGDTPEKNIVYILSEEDLRRDGGDTETPLELTEIDDNATPLARFTNRFQPRGISYGGRAWALLNMIVLFCTAYLFLPVLHLRAKYGRIGTMKKMNRMKAELRTASELDEKALTERLLIHREAAEEKAREEGRDVETAVREAEAENFVGITQDDFAKAVETLYYHVTKYVRRFRLGIVLELLLVAVAAYVFAHTQNIRLPMVLIDKWTPLMLLLLILCWVTDICLAQYRDKLSFSVEETDSTPDEIPQENAVPAE